MAETERNDCSCLPCDKQVWAPEQSLAAKDTPAQGPTSWARLYTLKFLACPK